MSLNDGLKIPLGVGCNTKNTRTSEGFYSENGLRHLADGDIKCRPEEVVYVGDRMNARPQSYEISFLVPLLIDLSIYLNKCVKHEKIPKLYKDCSFLPQRVNLRFLADMRNLGLLVIVVWWCMH